LAESSEALLAGKGGAKKSAKKGCWLNCRQMCCNKRITTQEELLQMHITADAEAKTDAASRDSAVE
jgi:hypothetical protein